MRDRRKAGRTRGHVSNRAPRAEEWRVRGAGVERPVEITETRIEERSLVEFIALVLRASEAPNTFSTPGFQLATLAISRDRILSILISFVSSFFPSHPQLARYGADLAIALARCLSTSSLNTRLYRASRILNAY